MSYDLYKCFYCESIKLTEIPIIIISLLRNVYG